MTTESGSESERDLKIPHCSFEDGGNKRPQARESRRLAEAGKGKETDSLRSSRVQSCLHLDFSSSQTSDLQNLKVVNVLC